MRPPSAGPPPESDLITWSPNAILAERFYRTISTLIHKTGGSRENYCRAVVEADAYRVVPIVEHAYCFARFIDHGETDFMTPDSDDATKYSPYHGDLFVPRRTMAYRRIGDRRDFWKTGRFPRLMRLIHIVRR
jgi:hypothetical protein